VKNGGHRLSFLIVESEPEEGLSTRKLLIESAKHNVLTAYSAQEGIEMFKRFPKVDVVVIHSDLMGNNELAKQVKQQNPEIGVVCLAPNIGAKAPWADETANPHDPAELLKLLERMGGRTDI
jgi:CheY-like chemotaxis protein